MLPNRANSMRILIDNIFRRGCNSCLCRHEDQYGRGICSLLVRPIPPAMRGDERLSNCPLYAVIQEAQDEDLLPKV